MRKIIVTLAVPVLVAVSWTACAGDAPETSQLVKARSAVKALGENLKGQLVAALKSGGPVSALGVCQTIAPAAAQEVSDAQGLEIGRTALRVRNPANAADEWERGVLEDFVAKIAAGADPATLEHGETVHEDGETLFRYIKAIPMAAEPCLTCHGSDLEPALAAEVQRLYPSDEATGFKAGELRGAFTVKERVD